LQRPRTAERYSGRASFLARAQRSAGSGESFRPFGSKDSLLGSAGAIGKWENRVSAPHPHLTELRPGFVYMPSAAPAFATLAPLGSSDPACHCQDEDEDEDERATHFGRWRPGQARRFQFRST